MRKTLREIEQEYSIPTATLRAAIHRGMLRAEKAGGIRLIDDESDSFQTYVADYRGRSGSGKEVQERVDGGNNMDDKPRLGITLGLCNQKGGVGKSSTAAALASIFAEKGYRVLVIDSDPQANVSLQLGVDCLDAEDGGTNENIVGTVSDLYLERASAHEVAISTSFENVYLVPASVELAEVEMALPGKTGSDLRLRMALKQSRAHFDLIILDSPPNLGKFAVNVLAASDWFLVPVDGPWALRSVKALLTVARKNASYYDCNNQFLGLFLTMVDRTKIMQSVREVANERYAKHILKSEIRRSTLARESAALATPLPIYARDSSVAEDYRGLAREIGSRIGIEL
jgi:chromosome partitioning protein